MKKKLSLTLSAVLMVSIMSACGSAGNMNSSDTALSVFGSTGENETMQAVTIAPVSQAPTTTGTGGVYTPKLDEDGNVVQDDEAVETGGNTVSQGDAEATAAPSPTASGGITNSTDTAVSPSPSPSSSSGKTGTSGKTGSGSGSSGSSRTGLAKALEDVLDNSSLPGQTSGSDTKYALADIDGDGSSEVIVRYSTGSGTKEAICTVSGGKLVVQKQSYVGATYYSNGDIVIGSSKTKGYSGSRLSPYTVLVYNSSTDSYTESVSVDGWDKTLSAVTKDDGEVEDLDAGEEEVENSFPDAVDTDGNGYIYIINGGSDGDELVDDAEYQEWYASIFGGATKVSVGFTTLTEDAIENLD